jgi:FkbM family methyltransferase
MRLSKLASAFNPIAQLARIDSKLHIRAQFDDALAARVIEMLEALDRRLASLESRQERMWSHIEFVGARLNTYVGEGMVLAHTVDGTPILVNGGDTGCPSALINGGGFEESNQQVLLSFVRPDTVFLDIGANIGFYTLQVGRRLTTCGMVYAFEPHPRLAKILQSNVDNMLLRNRVRCLAVALSDRNGTIRLHYPPGHLGGGSVVLGPSENSPRDVIEREARRLDDLLAPDFRCDLVKIDVEGYEKEVLSGMCGIIARSPQIKILFENLGFVPASEAALEKFFSDLGFDCYGVDQNASLTPLAHPWNWKGCILAARPGAITDGFARSRFSIYPAHLCTPGDTSGVRAGLERSAESGGVLFHGPYWFLRRGIWRLKLHGELIGAADFVLQEAWGCPVLSFTLQHGRLEHVFTINRDLLEFEFFVVAREGGARVSLDRLELIQEG